MRSLATVVVMWTVLALVAQSVYRIFRTACAIDIGTHPVFLFYVSEDALHLAVAAVVTTMAHALRDWTSLEQQHEFKARVTVALV